MQYMIRIELHNAKDESLYERLHALAAAEYLSRTLTNSVTGEKSQALTGTYWTEAYSTWQEVMAAAKRAASTVHRSFGVMVAGDGTIHYFNCPAQPTQRIGSLLAAARRTTPAPLATRMLPPVFAPVSKSPRPLRELMPAPKTLTPLEALYESLRKP